jgi:hypothetical protein
MTRSWFSQFSIEHGFVHSHETGARLKLDASLLCDVAAWLTYYVPLRLRAAFAQTFRPGPALWYIPREPSPWYMVWNASAWIGARSVKRREDADAAFYFEDSTWGELADDEGCINGGCLDVSKSRVAAAFERVFGYALAIDPRTASGFVVEKGERNGAHDGRLAACPRDPTPGRVYQRLIDTGDGAFVEDLRTPCAGGEPILVFVKRRPRADRFANWNKAVKLAEPGDVFSIRERAQIKAFCREMRLDWGGLDILRERSTGRLYIVDVNKTDMPPLALPFLDKMRASRRLGFALEKLVADMKPSSPAPFEHGASRPVDHSAPLVD